MKKLFILLLIGVAFTMHGQDFKSIDEHALNTPDNVQNDVEKLTNYLIEPANTDLEKIRAFYVWIADNIEYDVKLFFSSIIPTEEITAVDVLKSGKSVCQGYSELFKTMCEISGITCYIIPGYSKGYGWNPNRSFHTSDHAWNAVKINNEWKLLDVTWASGYLNEKNMFEKKFEEKFFLTAPEKFVFDHLPSNPMWQLLDCPVTIDEFRKDSTEIKQIIANKEKCFSYRDSIAYFETLNPSEQQLKSALSAYYFNADLTDDVGFAYMNFAYEKTKILMNENTQLSNQERYDLQKEILDLYEISKDFFKKSKTNIAKNALQVVNDNIKNSKHNLDVFEKILENQ